MTARRQGGFTMIEVTLVVLILLALTAITMPKMRSTMQHLRLKQGARDVAALLRLARDSAVTRQLPVEVIFDLEGEGNRYQLALLDEMNERVEETERRSRRRTDERIAVVGREVLRVRELPDGVAFAQVSTAAPMLKRNDRPRVVFHPDGSATPATIGLQDGRQRTLSIEIYRATGLARVEPGLPPVEPRSRTLVYGPGSRK